VSGDDEKKIRRWRIEDGKEVGTPIDAWGNVRNIAVSRDGNLIASGTMDGFVTVWDAERHSKVTEFRPHEERVLAVDFSPDGTNIMTGSEDGTACVWSLSTGERLLGPLEHDFSVAAAKFSPDGRLIATATWHRDSVRVYDSQNGSLLVEFPVKANLVLNNNHSLAWASDSNQLFVFSHDAYIHHVDVSAKTTLSQWRIHSTNYPTCIALESNNTFIAASAGPSVSFWDTTSHEQIGTIIKYTHQVWSLAMSPNYDLVTSGNNSITLQALRGILPPRYIDNVSLPAFKNLAIANLSIRRCRPPARRKSSTQSLKFLTTVQVRSFASQSRFLISMSIRRKNSESRANHPGTRRPARSGGELEYVLRHSTHVSLIPAY